MSYNFQQYKIHLLHFFIAFGNEPAPCQGVLQRKWGLSLPPATRQFPLQGVS